MITTRAAAPPADAHAMCALLNPIIAAGGTTAFGTPFDTARMTADCITPPRHLIRCTLAVEDEGVLGFQILEHADPNWKGPGWLPEGWAVIASFVAQDQQGRGGVGQRLWRETLLAAKVAGVASIDATIRADNVPGGLAYYAGLGFRDYDRIEAVPPLADGRKTDRIRKRFDL